MYDDIDLLDFLDAAPSDRAALSIPIEAAESLIEFYEVNPPPWHWLELAWTLRKSFGDDGYDLFRIAAFSWDPPEREQCIDEAWEQVNRDGPTQFDRILFDAMNAARWDGWKPPAELAILFERLAAKEIEIDEKWAATVQVRAHLENKMVAAPATSHGKNDQIIHEDFWAYSPAHSYIFVPTGEHWPASTVNSRLAPVSIPMREKPLPAATWLDQNRSVEQATWAPGQPQIIADRLIADGGWIDRVGCKTFNLYRPPTVRRTAGDASPWIDHIRYIYPDEADHIIKWLAQRVQRPEQKINHALVLGGNQGIGKDTLLEPVKAAVGPWNCSEVSPQQVLGRFNSFVKSVILRISEARDLGDTDRFAFYEHLKTLTAAPPDVLRVDEKHLREHAVLNVCGVIQTTNNKDALHLPADDRRHFVAWSPRSKDDFQPGYWHALYRWFANGGNEIVAHHLATLDLGGFDAKAPPPKTRAFWEIVDASRAPEDAELADAIDALGKPDAVTIDAVLFRAAPGFGEWLRDRKNRRKIGHRFEACGYVPVRNPDDARDGQWKISGRRRTVYARRTMPVRDQIAAAQRLTVPLPPSV